MKALVLGTGALIGIAVSAVVFSFQQALSPYFGFLVLVVVGYWLRDVRRSPPGSSGPNWRSFFLGSAVWIGVAIGALLLKSWLSRHPPHAANDVAVGAALLLAFGIVCIGYGIYGYRGHPSQRVIERWAELDSLMPIFGMFSAAIPLGVTTAILGAALIVNHPDVFGPLIIFAIVLGGVATLLLFWQPRWLKPAWLRRYQDTAGQPE